MQYAEGALSDWVPSSGESQTLQQNMREALAQISARHEGAFGPARELCEAFIPIEEETHLKWRSDITRSLHLFEDKMSEMRRADEAESALLARTLSEQEGYAPWDQDTAGLQRALQASIYTQSSQAEEDFELARALSASVAQLTPATENVPAPSLQVPPTIQAELVQPLVVQAQPMMDADGDGEGDATTPSGWLSGFVRSCCGRLAGRHHRDRRSPAAETDGSTGARGLDAGPAAAHQTLASSVMGSVTFSPATRAEHAAE